MRTAALGPQAGRRNPAPAGRSRIKTIPAPVRGLVLNENLVASDPRGARVMTNWYPTETGVRVRKGASRVATIGAAATSMLVYRSGGAERLFAATAAAIHDVTSPADPAVAGAPVLTQLTGGAWIETQMATAGGQFMVAVNGADTALRYDGTQWDVLAGTEQFQVSYENLVTPFQLGETITNGSSVAQILAILPTSETSGTLILGPISPVSGFTAEFTGEFY